MSIQMAMDSISCSICLELLNEPVTIPCGHSYCKVCIKGCLDREEDTGIYSCPQCRQTFIPRPVLNKSTILVELVENLKKTKFQTAPPDHYSTGDVECDFCTGKKLKAVKSCLMCLASYCETHLLPHYEVAPLKKHKLVQASSQLQDKICSHHDRLMEIFCRTDQQCICYLCTMDEHKGHDTVSAAAEWTEKKKPFVEKNLKSQKRIQEREKEIEELKEAVDTLKRSAEAAVEDSERVFIELIRNIEKRCSEVKELIRAQENAEVNRAEVILEQLEKEVSELRRRDVGLKQLLYTEDHIHFLQNFRSLCVSPSSEALPSITVYPHISFEHVKKSVLELKDKLEDVCKKEIDKISKKVNAVQIERPVEPKKRQGLLPYSCQLTLDPNTAGQHLFLTEGNRKVTWSKEAQSYPDHPDRSTNAHVLCREGLSEVCYWEVDWDGFEVDITVSYKGIHNNAGCDSTFGCNNYSWLLECFTFGCCFWHNRRRKDFPPPSPSRIGVYLDYMAGILCFYSVSDTMTLLHRVHTTFTQPLYPGFGLFKGSAKILTPIQ